MIDRFLSTVGQLKQPVFDPNFRPEQAATEQLSLAHENQASDTLTVAFGGWHFPKLALSILASRLNRRGSDVLLYSLSPDILNDDATSVVSAFGHLSTLAGDRANELSARNAYKTVNLLGFSLGNIPMSMASEGIEKFDRVGMVVPGTDLLRCLRDGMRTQRLRQAIERQGATFAQLQTDWAELAPLVHLDVFRGHEVEVVLSKHDKFIPYKYGQELVDKMVELDLTPSVQTSEHLGHALTIMDYVRKI